MEMPGRHSDYCFVSLCGIERNFLRCYDTPVVFQKMLPAEDGRGHVLQFAGSMTVRLGVGCVLGGGGVGACWCR
jgi:hypothetical protein